MPETNQCPLGTRNETRIDNIENVIKSEFLEHNAKMDKLTEAILGNGKVGMKTELATTQLDVKSIKSFNNKILVAITSIAVFLACRGILFLITTLYTVKK